MHFSLGVRAPRPNRANADCTNCAHMLCKTRTMGSLYSYTIYIYRLVAGAHLHLNSWQNCASRMRALTRLFVPVLCTAAASAFCLCCVCNIKNRKMAHLLQPRALNNNNNNIIMHSLVIMNIKQTYQAKKKNVSTVAAVAAAAVVIAVAEVKKKEYS